MGIDFVAHGLVVPRDVPHVGCRIRFAVHGIEYHVVAVQVFVRFTLFNPIIAVLQMLSFLINIDHEIKTCLVGPRCGGTIHPIQMTFQ